MSTSIVIPCFQHGRYLADCINSALRQSCPAREIVVVDDGSSDNTRDVVKEFQDTRLTYVRQENKGLPSARNTGLRHCTSEFVVFLDADDQLDHRYIELTTSVMRECPPTVGYVYTQCLYFGSQQGVSHYPEWDAHRLMESNFVHASALLRRELVVQHPYDERLRLGSEDWNLYLTLAEHGIEGVLYDEALLRYRRHEGTSMLDQLRANRPRTVKMQQRIRRSHWRIWGLRRQLQSEYRSSLLYWRLRILSMRQRLRAST